MPAKKTDPKVETESVEVAEVPSKPTNPHPGEIAIAVVAERIKNPNPPPPGPKPVAKRIKK